MKEDDLESKKESDLTGGHPLKDNTEDDHPPPPPDKDRLTQEDPVILGGVEVIVNTPRSVPP